MLARLVEQHGNDPRPRSARARLAERRQRPELAEAYWRRVLALRPDELSARIGVSPCFARPGPLHRGPGLLPHALEPAPGRGRPPPGAGPHSTRRRRAPVVAEARWRRAAMVTKQAPESPLGLAQALAAQHRFAAAGAILEQQGRTQPGRTEALTALARTLLLEGDLDRADQVLGRLIAREPGRIEHRLTRGRVLEQRWDYPAAGSALPRAGGSLARSGRGPAWRSLTWPSFRVKPRRPATPIVRYSASMPSMSAPGSGSPTRRPSSRTWRPHDTGWPRLWPCAREPARLAAAGPDRGGGRPRRGGAPPPARGPLRHAAAGAAAALADRPSRCATARSRPPSSMPQQRSRRTRTA